jgi:alkanesulfonate monooxygenase SsuD/methylene tetrahydromethanopterin reductase-like flavin-dependent oxidoreductase (luciferase family)
VEVGVHLPVLDFGDHPFTLDHLVGVTRTASELGFTGLAVNDHLVFGVPWLDGPIALAAVLAATGTMTLATTVALPVVRGPLPLAKAVAALDRLSGGRLMVGVGPGSSARDYAAVGVDFEERWPRFDEAVVALRALLGPADEPFVGRWYSTVDIAPEPLPTRAGGPPIWIGSWGSDAGLRRVARLGDGWLASAYNVDAGGFADARDRLAAHLAARGRAELPNALATMFCYLTERRADAEAVLTERVAQVIRRPEDDLRARLLVGDVDTCVEKLIALRDAGVQRVYVWPVGDERRQLELFAERVRPALAG